MGKTIRVRFGCRHVRQFQKKTGIKVVGRHDWLNISMYRPVPSRADPSASWSKVQFEQTDRGAWINDLKIPGDSTPAASPVGRQRPSAVLHHHLAAQLEAAPSRKPTKRFVWITCSRWPTRSSPGLRREAMPPTNACALIGTPGRASRCCL